MSMAGNVGGVNLGLLFYAARRGRSQHSTANAAYVVSIKIATCGDARRRKSGEKKANRRKAALFSYASSYPFICFSLQSNFCVSLGDMVLEVPLTFPAFMHFSL